MSFFSRKKDPLHILLFDINSTSVGVSVLLLEQGSPLSIEYTARKPLRFTKNTDTSYVQGTLGETIKDVCLKVQKEYLHTGNNSFKKTFDEVHVVLSTPYIASLIEEKSADFNPATEVTYALLTQIADHTTEQGNISVESKIMEVYLNGYKVESPFGKKAKDLSLIVYSSYAHLSFIQEIEKSIAAFFSIDRIEYHSFTISAYMAFKNVYRSLDSYVFLNITGETTEFIVVENKELKFTDIFPYGIRTLARDIALTLNIPLEEAYTRIVRICTNDYADDAFAETQKVLVDSMKKWTDLFIRTLDSSIEVLLPDTSFIFRADQNISDLFGHTLIGAIQNKVKNIPTDNIIPILDSNFVQYCEYAPLASHDALLAIEAISILSLRQ